MSVVRRLGFLHLNFELDLLLGPIEAAFQLLFTTKFFALLSDLTDPSKAPWRSHFVRMWFGDCYERLSSSYPFPHRWRSSGNRALIHDKTDRKIDLFVYEDATDDHADMADDDERVVIQLSSYSYETFVAQPSRRFVNAFSVVNSEMRCWISHALEASRPAAFDAYFSAI
ncbi:hypothetical protein FN846DRAFT_914626 [Sphaerosporella brunnea]|uniref:Fungal-type protein kinase domain-containing protein n=1 Tax=Sphaerosporella brunnea TaxID=1250544 RepID=A0A5J5EBQ0_9PEZI|nr:hypothetical protein FN846DRAFT_914626 [Sphaerosporella brunnea]